MAQSPNVVISQVYGAGGNSGAVYTNDFIEILNRGSEPVSLAGLSLQYASATGTGNLGIANQITLLPDVTLNAGQYYLIREAGGLVGSPLPVAADIAGAINLSGTAGKVALINSMTSLGCNGGSTACSPAQLALIIDLIGYGGANFFEGGGPAPALSATTAAVRQDSGRIDTDNNAADFIAGPPAPRNSSSPTSITPPIPVLAIHDIQGPTNFSTWATVRVQTEGIVTAVKSNGFFIQAPDAEADADVNTSEGIFVFTSSTPPAAAVVGNRVKVRGFVQNFIPASDPLSPPVTEIANSPTVTALSESNQLPTAITLTPADFNPAGSLAQLSKYEGMRVRVDTLVAVSPTGGTINEAAATATSSGIFFGVLPGTPRPFREPGIEAPAAAPAGVPQFDGNPERLRVDSDGQFGTRAFDLSTGAVVSNLTGVLDFGSRTYTVIPDPGIEATVTNNDTHALPVRASADEGEITVASFNLERFYDTADDPATSDAVLSAAAFDQRLAKASLAIRNVLHAPDVLGVEEMENLGTLQALAARIDLDAQAAGQMLPSYEAYLIEGNDIGGIDVGLLVKKDRIDVDTLEQVGKNTTFVQPDGIAAILNDRPPLVMKGSVKRRGREMPLSVTLIVNHLRSLSGIEGNDGARIRAKRLAQAEFLASLINIHQQSGEHVIAVGDYNAFDVNDGYVDVINTVRGGAPHPSEDVVGESAQWVDTPLIDLAPADPAQHYSYVFSGNAQVLDHIIVSQGLAVNDFVYARNDADFPESLRNDPTRPERISDHDAPVAYFAVPRDTVPPTVIVTGVTEGAVYGAGAVPVVVCSTTDDASGVKTPATVQITAADSGPNGTGSFTATCTGAIDNVGNVAADVAVHYRVVAYAFVGFEPPLEKRVGTIESGSVLPLIFQVYDWNGTLMTSTSVISAIEFAPNVTCSGVPANGWESAASRLGIQARFFANRFSFLWNTSGLPAGCYTIAVRTADALKHSALVAVRK